MYCNEKIDYHLHILCFIRTLKGDKEIADVPTFPNFSLLINNFHIKLTQHLNNAIDAHRGVRGGINVYKIFAQLVNKDAMKHQKGVPYPQNVHNPYIPSASLPKFGKNLMDPPSGFSNRVHL